MTPLPAQFLINCINAMNAQWFAAIVVQSATLLETTLTQVYPPLRAILVVAFTLMLMSAFLLQRRSGQLVCQRLQSHVTSLLPFCTVALPQVRRQNACHRRRWAQHRWRLDSLRRHPIGCPFRPMGHHPLRSDDQRPGDTASRMPRGDDSEGTMLIISTYRRLSLALGATYSQIWFPLSERLIATMILTACRLRRVLLSL